MRKLVTALGGSRFVILFGKYVIKLPYLKTFRRGRNQNIKEWQDRGKSSHLAPLYFSFPFGLCNIMRRAKPLAGDVSSGLIREYFKAKIKSEDELAFILEDSSIGNFGVINGSLVKIDWGGYGQ